MKKNIPETKNICNQLAVIMEHDSIFEIILFDQTVHILLCPFCLNHINPTSAENGLKDTSCKM